MSEDSTKQIFSDLFRYLEVLETQNAAMLQFLKDKNVIKESQFGSYLDQAAAATDVKWRAARVRMEHLLAEVPQPKAQPLENGTKEAPKTEKTTTKSSEKRDGEVQAAEKKDVSGDESGDKQAKPAAADGTKEGSKTEKAATKTSEKHDGDMQAAAKKPASRESGEKQASPAAAARPQEGKPTPQSDQLEAKAQPDAKMDKTSQPSQENATPPEKKPASDKRQTSEESKPGPRGIEKPESPAGAKTEVQAASSGESKPEGQQEKPEEHAGKDAA